MRIFRVPLLMATLAFSLTAAHAGDEWGTNYKAALTQAAKENKMVLLDFTGSDWCTWCLALFKETFSKPEFKKYAAEKLVLVELDFPNDKPQTAKVKKQNEELSEKYGVEGYPTLVLLNTQGREIARNFGFLPGGPQGFIAWVNSARK